MKRRPPRRRPRGYLGQRLLVVLLLWYRRRISGRGPLSGVRCTFAETESCSAYGLRMAIEARSLLQALRLIVGRIGRCGNASLYELPDGVSWGEAYDDCVPATLEANLTAARESARSRALMHRSAGLIAVRCGRRADAQDHLTRAAALCESSPRPCVRRTTRLARSLRARLYRRMALLFVVGCLVGALMSGPALWTGLTALFALALLAVAKHRRRTQRHDDLAVASTFTVPMDPG